MLRRLFDAAGGGLFEPIGDPVLISSAQATVDVEGDWSAFEKIRIDWTQLKCSASAQKINGRIRLDGTYETAANWAWVNDVHNDVGSSPTRSGAATLIQVHGNDMNSLQQNSCNGYLVLENVNSIVDRKRVTGKSNLRGNSNEEANFTDFAGEWTGADPIARIVNGWQFFMSSGNIERLWYQISGLKT